MRHLRLVLALVAGIGVGVAGDRLLLRGDRSPALAAPAVAAVPPVAHPPAAAPGAEDPKAVYRVPLLDSPTRGPRDALVTIVESADFECPFCKRVVPTLDQLRDRYRGKVRVVFKQNPLPMHLSALPAARLAEEARVEGGDGKFWELHDKIFELPALDRASLERAAREVGLRPAGVQSALDGPGHLDRIQRDQNLVSSLGAGGTPTFFVNGRKLVGAQPLESFQAVVDEELARAEALVRTGVAPADVYARLTDRGATAPVLLPGGSPPPAEVAKVPLRPDDPVRGPKAAPVTLVLFSDFQCPFCARVEPTLQQIREAYGDKVRIVWKHQPLPLHPDAMPAARAAEAARATGKFWEMHDKLFANQARLSEATYAQYARELGIDPARFQREVASEAVGRRIDEDRQLASAVGASGTPTVFVNCRRMAGARPFDSFKRVIDEELSGAKAMLARGDRLDPRFYDKICAANAARLVAAAR